LPKMKQLLDLMTQCNEQLYISVHSYFTTCEMMG